MDKSSNELLTKLKDQIQEDTDILRKDFDDQISPLQKRLRKNESDVGRLFQSMEQLTNDFGSHAATLDNATSRRRLPENKLEVTNAILNRQLQHASSKFNKLEHVQANLKARLDASDKELPDSETMSTILNRLVRLEAANHADNRQELPNPPSASPPAGLLSPDLRDMIPKAILTPSATATWPFTIYR